MDLKNKKNSLLQKNYGKERLEDYRCTLHLRQQMRRLLYILYSTSRLEDHSTSRETEVV